LDDAIVIRRAGLRDITGVVDLCRRIDASDFMIQAWPQWVHAGQGIQFVAEAAGRTVGSLHAGFVSSSAVFSQGLRVDPAYRRRGVAGRLIEYQNEAVRGRGFLVMRAVTGSDNARARRLLAAHGWRETSWIERRIRPAWRGSVDPLIAGRLPPIDSLRHRLWLGHEGPAHFHRIIVADAIARLEELVDQRRLLAADGVCAVLDPPRGADRWISSLAGTPAAIASLLEQAVEPAGPARATLTVDAPVDVEVQSLLDRLDFEPSGPRDRYVVVELILDNRAGRV
jgi:N-acetylglutamate synthase-like GNAT family acetyltransferase